MADAARALISKIIAEKDITTALSAGIRAEWFEDEEHHNVYAWMVEYFTEYQECPTRHALKLEFPTYNVIPKVEEPYEYYVDHFRKKRHRAILMDTVLDAHEHLTEADDPMAAQGRLALGFQQVGAEVSSLTDHEAGERWRDRYDEYDELRKHAGELIGIPTGFPTYDLITGGFQPEQFILFAGAAKQCKSWMMMKAAIAAQDYGQKVLFITFEMSLHEQMVRYDAMTCGLNSNKLLQKQLSDKDMTKLRHGMRVRRSLPPFVISSDIAGATTPSGLSGKIQEHQPDIVFVDGIYLMENESGADPLTPQAYTSLSRSIKRLAQRIKRPVVGTMQALTGKMDRTGRVTLHSLGWSSSWSQDADLVFGVERDPDSPLVTVRIVGGRNVSPASLELHCNWEESIFDEYDNQEGDEEERGPERRGTARPTRHRYSDDG